MKVIGQLSGQGDSRRLVQGSLRSSVFGIESFGFWVFRNQTSPKPKDLRSKTDGLNEFRKGRKEPLSSSFSKGGASVE